MRNILIGLAFVTCLLPANAMEGNYPAHWWEPVPRDSAPTWEILPQDANQGEVILSKRNELGLLSNFAPTPFVFRGKKYPGVEGLWQSMKYPENDQDPRAHFPGVSWKYTREEVEKMTAFEAKEAGTLGSENMKKMGINWVSFEGQQIVYKTSSKGEHYKLIVQIMGEKLRQNPEVKKTLLSTGDLILRPDHVQEASTPPAWEYHKIWMEYRDNLRNN